MITPEAFRRRQLLEGVALVVIGIFIAAQSVYFNTQDTRQDDEDMAQRSCFEKKFRELSVALDARAELTERETAQNKALWLIYAEAAGLLKDDPTAELTPKDQSKFQRKLVAQLLEYRKVINEIERDRRRNPVPPYPVGVCGD